MYVCTVDKGKFQRFRPGEPRNASDIRWKNLSSDNYYIRKKKLKPIFLFDRNTLRNSLKKKTYCNLPSTECMRVKRKILQFDKYHNFVTCLHPRKSLEYYCDRDYCRKKNLYSAFSPNSRHKTDLEIGISRLVNFLVNNVTCLWDIAYFIVDTNVVIKTTRSR